MKPQAVKHFDHGCELVTAVMQRLDSVTLTRAEQQVAVSAVKSVPCERATVVATTSRLVRWAYWASKKLNFLLG